MKKTEFENKRYNDIKTYLKKLPMVNSKCNKAALENISSVLLKNYFFAWPSDAKEKLKY